MKSESTLFSLQVHMKVHAVDLSFCGVMFSFSYTATIDLKVNGLVQIID